MGNEKLLPIAFAIQKIETKLESVRTEIVRLDGASRVVQGHVKSFDSWVLGAKEELIKLVEEGKTSLDSANFALSWLNKARGFMSDLSSTTSKVHTVKQGEAIGITDSIQVLKSIVEEEVKKQVLAEQQAVAAPIVEETNDENMAKDLTPSGVPEVSEKEVKRGRPKGKVRPDDASTRLGKTVQDIKSRRRRAKP